jgi:hypothetical protein
MSRAQASGELPPAFAETLPHLPTQQSVAIVCTGKECLPPVTQVVELAEQIASLFLATKK